MHQSLSSDYSSDLIVCAWFARLSQQVRGRFPRKMAHCTVCANWVCGLKMRCCSWRLEIR